MSTVQKVLDEAYGADSRIRVIHVQEFQAGDALVPNSETATEASRKVSHNVTLVKLFLRTTGPAPETPSPDAGTDVGMELWLPEASAWNQRVRCQIQGAFMGDFRVTSPEHFSLPICTDLLSGEIASELGYVVATTDGGHANPDMEDFAYLMNVDGSVNAEGWKNIAYQATHLLGQKTKELAEAYYGIPPKFSYLYGCSSGGRAAYHSAQKYPEDFNGLLIGAPSLTQSLMFPSLLHTLVVIQNDLAGEPFRDDQLEMVSQKAIAAGDQVVNGQHDLYLTDWESNSYDPIKDPSVLVESEGGTCTEPWALSLAQAKAINKIWYGPTTDGSIPDPSTDNGTLCPLRPNQLFWGKIRGTRLQHLTVPRAAATNLLALALGDASVASPNWDRGGGKGQDSWRTWTYKEYADALSKCHSMDESFAGMDADDPSRMTSIQKHGAKILTYHGLADQVTNPQNSINYYRRSSEHTGGIEKTREFHRLVLIPGMGHCFRAPGCVGSGNPPIPTLEELFSALVTWTEDSISPEALIAKSIDGKVSRPIVAYQGKPVWPAYKGGEVDSASNYEV
jgi:pimeloyl-ACP methyl ester carboxylesterase